MVKQSTTYATITTNIFNRDVVLEYDFALITGKSSFKVMVDACIENDVSFNVTFSQSSIQGV